MNVRRLTTDAILTVIALTIFMIELQIPSLTPIPGIKLGLANIVTVFAIFALEPIDAALILIARILIGGMFSGQLTALIYSLSGGTLCYVVMLIMRKIVSKKQIWVSSVIGAVAHNIGQITAAIIVTETLAIALYIPVLIISGLIAGLFTGLCAQWLYSRTEKIIIKRL